MLKLFYPKLHLRSIFSINPQMIKKYNIKGIIFDIDNTLAPYHVAKVNEKTKKHLKKLMDSGVKIALFSNNNEKRVQIFNDSIGLNLFAVHRANKPLIYKIKKIEKTFNLKSNEIAICGDQVFTDVFCANRAKMVPILVKQIDTKDEWITKIKRGAESRVLRSYSRHRRKGLK